MSDFLRPEARSLLWRWREVAAALAVTALGLWWLVTTFGPLRWVGLMLALLGGGAALAAVQRVRFGRGGGGQGVVTIDEARIAYLGPFGGGMVDLGALRRLELDREARPAHWWLLTTEGPGLAIPVDAEGADDLFDAFARLPGLSPPSLTRALDRSGGRETLWQRADPRLPRGH